MIRVRVEPTKLEVEHSTISLVKYMTAESNTGQIISQEAHTMILETLIAQRESVNLELDQVFNQQETLCEQLKVLFARKKCSNNKGLISIYPSSSWMDQQY